MVSSVLVICPVTHLIAEARLPRPLEFCPLDPVLSLQNLALILVGRLIGGLPRYLPKSSSLKPMNVTRGEAFANIIKDLEMKR